MYIIPFTSDIDVLVLECLHRCQKSHEYKKEIKLNMHAILLIGYVAYDVHNILYFRQRNVSSGMPTQMSDVT
jgi:uncharacterized protein YvpB